MFKRWKRFRYDEQWDENSDGEDSGGGAEGVAASGEEELSLADLNEAGLESLTDAQLLALAERLAKAKEAAEVDGADDGDDGDDSNAERAPVRSKKEKRADRKRNRDDEAGEISAVVDEDAVRQREAQREEAKRAKKATKRAKKKANARALKRSAKAAAAAEAATSAGATDAADDAGPVPSHPLDDVE